MAGPKRTHNISFVKEDGENTWWVECRESLEGVSLGKWVSARVDDPEKAKIDGELHATNPMMVRGERVAVPAKKKG